MPRPETLTTTIQQALDGLGGARQSQVSPAAAREACMAAARGFEREYGNSREVALTITKLQEVGHWALQGDREQQRIKYTEALAWAQEAVAEAKALDEIVEEGRGLVEAEQGEAPRA